MENIHIIAEAGTNNNGSLQKAKNLADIAKRAGADSVKFQIIYPWGLYLPGEYEYGKYDIKKVIEIREKGVLKDEEYADLNEYCKSIKIPFTSSVFDKRGLDLMMSFDPPYIKLASCDINNVRFLREVAKCGKPIVISTGMSTMPEIEIGVNALVRSGAKEVIVMHCVSNYPAYLHQSNISYIKVLREKFGLPVGFSDHTGDSVAACMALCMGATWFEKHFTEDKTQEGLDHAYAQEEKEFSKYVKDIRDAAKALILREDKVSEDEKYTKRRARRSLYAAGDLAAGHILTDDDVLCVRPENTMSADQIDLLIGKKLLKPISLHQAFDLSFIG
ncbi:MAG: N-acetylneuraminate synthase family protein [Bacteroidia bacterium]